MKNLKWEKGDDGYLEAHHGGFTYTILTGSLTLVVDWGRYEFFHQCDSTRHAKAVAQSHQRAREKK